MSNNYLSLGFIGAGNMAYGLAKGIVNSGKKVEISVYDPDIERQDFIKNALGVTILNSISEVIKNSELVFIAVKPSVVASVLETASGAINGMKSKKEVIFVSIAGGVSISAMRQAFGKYRGASSIFKVVRVMPNINSLIGGGMSVVCSDNSVKERELKTIIDILKTSSKVLVLEEKYFDAVTALSGSGPAYFFLIAEAFIEAGIKLGFSRGIAKSLVVQTILGSSELLNSKEFGSYSIQELMDMVTSPGGTTAYGLSKLEEGRIKYVIDSAVNAAYLRSKELAFLT